MNSIVHNMDCIEGMKQYPDNHFDLAIVDPPYGIGIDGQKKTENKNPKHNRKYHERKDWDSSIPNAEYFNELERVSVNRIIWGANYFVSHITTPTKGWIFWYKGQEGLTMSDGEIAFSSFQCPTRMVNINRGFIASTGGSIHPTQKPVKLYEWILERYAKQGDKILDTHLGSGSSRIAAYKMGFDFTGYELDKDYYEAQEKRFNDFKAQLVMQL